MLASITALAEVLSVNTQMLRVRLGDNATGGTNTIVYEPGVPAALGGLPGVIAEPQTTSTTAVAGGSGAYTVRIVTDVNARGSVAPLTGTFSYDSSQPMTCITPATCGTASIPFTQISWSVRDGDTHTSVSQFDGSANQFIQEQTDTHPGPTQADTRHRNYLQYIFDNATLLPAGTYEGTVSLNGSGQF